MFPYRISCTILRVPRIADTATSIIPSHHEIIRAVVHRRSDRSILFADLPVSRIRVAQSVSSSFGFPDNTRNTPVHFCRLRCSLSRTEGGKRDEKDFIQKLERVDRRPRADHDRIKILIVRRGNLNRWSPIFARKNGNNVDALYAGGLNTRDPVALRIYAKHVSCGLAIKLRLEAIPVSKR